MTQRLPRIIAHRFGGKDLVCDHHPTDLEETLKLPVHTVEFDVRALKDGTFVAHYGEFIKDIYGKQNLLSDLTWKGFVSIYRSKHGVDPFTLKEILTLVHGSKKQILVDLKDKPCVETETRMFTEITQGDSFPATTFVSRSNATLKNLKRLSQDTNTVIQIGLPVGTNTTNMSLVNKKVAQIKDRMPGRNLKETSADAIMCWHLLAKSTISAYAEKKKVPLVVYTVDTIEDLLYWTQPGKCDAVITNYPERALAALKLNTT